MLPCNCIFRGSGDPGQLNIFGQLVDKKKDQIKGLLDQIKALKDQVKGIKDGIPIVGDIKGPKPGKSDKDDKKPKDSIFPTIQRTGNLTLLSDQQQELQRLLSELTESDGAPA